MLAASSMGQPKKSLIVDSMVNGRVRQSKRRRMRSNGDSEERRDARQSLKLTVGLKPTVYVREYVMNGACDIYLRCEACMTSVWSCTVSVDDLRQIADRSSESFEAAVGKWPNLCVAASGNRADLERELQ